MQGDDEFKAALKAWRDGLVGLTRANRLIKFTSPRTSSLKIESPGPDEVLARVRSGKPLSIRGFSGSAAIEGEDATRALIEGAAVLSVRRPDSELGPVLRTLMRRASAEFIERGLSVLYLAFGMVQWRDKDGSVMNSPVLLVPVTLVPEGPQASPRLSGSDDDPTLNPALMLRFKEDFNIEFPSVENFDDVSVSQVLEAVRTALSAKSDFRDWHLEATTHLSTFAFAKESMFRDLLNNEAEISAHPIVRALATSDPLKQSDEFHFEPIASSDIDRLAPPELNPLVLDADSSQRVAVAAALDGKSFVMDGPPGTGKSQTIANMIGGLLHSGKTVLFVSEKIAALDVVRNRLREAGLDNYLLELHSHKARRKEVAAELLRSLDQVTLPPMGMSPLDLNAVKERRESLNAYAEAMNQVRRPLNMSLHHVLGRLSELADVPSAPQPERRPAELTQESYQQIREVSAQLERAWRPAAQGSSFLWRDVVEDASLEIRLQQAERDLDRLDETAALNDPVVQAFSLSRPSDAPRLSALIDHWNARPAGDVISSWVVSDIWWDVLSAIARLRELIAEAHGAEEAFRTSTGMEWQAVPAAGELPPAPDPVDVPYEGVDISGLPEAELGRVAAEFGRRADDLSNATEALNGVAAWLGLGQIETFEDADLLLRLLRLADHPYLPEFSWFAEGGVEGVRTAAAALGEGLARLSGAEGRATQRFGPESLEAPLAELQDRFTNLHKGLKKLSGSYRADKRELAALLTDATTISEGIRNLSDAIAWRDAAAGFDALSRVHARTLGRYWRGRETDFHALSTALSVVDEANFLLAGGVTPQLARYLSGELSGQAQRRSVEDACALLNGWKSVLEPAPAVTGRPQLAVNPISASIEWLRAHLPAIERARSRIAAFRQDDDGAWTLQRVEMASELRTVVADAHRSLRHGEPTYLQLLGSYYQGRDTDLGELDAAVAWVEQLRTLTENPLTTAQLDALTDSTPVPQLLEAHERWVRSSELVIAAFSPWRHDELRAELDSYEEARGLFGDLLRDSVGQQEWFDYQAAREQLEALGLGQAIDFCVAQRVDEKQLPAVIEKAVLRGWADSQIRNDPALKPHQVKDREVLIEDYRRLDRELVAHATSEIIRAANTRRPSNTDIGEPAIIRREGAKQKRHIPVRDLIARTKTTAQSIKPVFMMSPLAVSQYLPSDMKFDVVIFDEASQVTPGDAINCVYRGKALILAGDDRQLPPSSFFERLVDTDDLDTNTDVKDFQSVLELAKASGAFKNLPLRWHYRSRHEDLIAFSNYKFYEGKLVTYPSAQTEGLDIGVAFFEAGGVYRRGGGADNPLEARMVAERVIDHLTHRPELTLGVVTFSVAQADAVQLAIDEARTSRRDLDRFFETENRLDGFFVRSLESVQGDERDVMIFSVGYGPDEAGKISTNFGVLNKSKGWRRLNVGITRARQRNEIVASMRARDIPPSENESVNYLRAYLDYAERGRGTLSIEHSPSGLGPESPFEESVISTIRSWGYEVEPQVGSAGFRIDIGIRHPAHPGSFALGVECDGFQYHSAPAARDRDRLRDQILQGLGWTLHRIWGTAWYRHRRDEEDRLRRAIDLAIEAPPGGSRSLVPSIQRPRVETVDAEPEESYSWVDEYVETKRVPLPNWVDPSEPGSDLHMRKAIETIAAVEGPVHMDLVEDRLREWWGIGRIGSKIRENVDRAVRRAKVSRDGRFIDVPDRALRSVRAPSEWVRRKVEQVHLTELAAAAEQVLRGVGAAQRGEVIVQVARVFQWYRTGDVVQQRVGEAIDLAIAEGRIRADGATLRSTS